MKISVVIPCRNEEKNIKECIDAIYSSILDHDLEVIVVDGQSDDNTLQIIQGLREKYSNLSVVPNPQRVTPAAFNIGISKSTGDYLQIVGARQIISENYLQLAVKTLIDMPDVWCVGGAVENVYMSKESKVIGLAMGSTFGVGGSNFRVVKESGYVDTAGTPMYPKWVFDKIGLFDESLIRNQDDELNYRLLKAGGKIWLNTEIKIKYYVRASANKLFKQYYQYGYWKVYVNKIHKTVTTLRQLVPFLFVSGLILGFALSLFVPYFGWVYLLGIAFYLVSAIIFGLKAANSIGQGISIARIFPILHLSYGWGYLIGIIHFIIFNRKPSTKSKQLTR